MWCAIESRSETESWKDKNIFVKARTYLYMPMNKYVSDLKFLEDFIVFVAFTRFLMIGISLDVLG